MAVVPPTTRTLKDGTPIVLRCAEESDAHAVMGFKEENAREYTHTIYAPDEVDGDVDAMRRKIREYRTRSNWLLQAALCAGTPVGAVSFRGGITRRTQHQGMLGISVAGPWRRRGVGRALMDFALDWGAAHPLIEKVSLFVFADNAPAIALYRSLGFSEEGRRIREIRLSEGQYADDLVLARFVKPVARAQTNDRANRSSRN